MKNFSYVSIFLFKYSKKLSSSEKKADGTSHHRRNHHQHHHFGRPPAGVLQKKRNKPKFRVSLTIKTIDLAFFYVWNIAVDYS
jgi:hypothetical protein